MASSIYRKANDYGWVLRDHHENQFRAEFNTGNWLQAYLVSASDISEGGSSREKSSREDIKIDRS